MSKALISAVKQLSTHAFGVDKNRSVRSFEYALNANSTPDQLALLAQDKGVEISGLDDLLAADAFLKGLVLKSVEDASLRAVQAALRAALAQTEGEWVDTDPNAVRQVAEHLNAIIEDYRDEDTELTDVIEVASEDAFGPAAQAFNSALTEQFKEQILLQSILEENAPREEKVVLKELTPAEYADAFEEELAHISRYQNEIGDLRDELEKLKDEQAKNNNAIASMRTELNETRVKLYEQRKIRREAEEFLSSRKNLHTFDGRAFVERTPVNVRLRLVSKAIEALEQLIEKCEERLNELNELKAEMRAQMREVQLNIRNIEGEMMEWRALIADGLAEMRATAPSPTNR